MSEFGPATDVYGLGGLLYLTLYGSAPNQGQSSAATLLNLESVRLVQRGTLRSGILPRGQRIRKEALDPRRSSSEYLPQGAGAEAGQTLSQCGRDGSRAQRMARGNSTSTDRVLTLVPL